MAEKQRNALFTKEEAYKAFGHLAAPTPLPDAEKRLQAPTGALLKLCDEAEGPWLLMNNFVKDIREAIKNNT